MNFVTLVGNIVADPEFTNTQSGVACCKIRVACQRRYKNQQTGQYDADFINCVAFRQTAEFIHKHFIKGNRIGITGSIQTGSYTAKDGSKRYTTDVIVDSAEFVAPRNTDGQGAQAVPAPAGDDEFVEVDDEGLPF